MDVVSFFIYSFVSIFVIVSPIGVVVTFISLTSSMTQEEKNSIATRATLLACTICIFFAVTGHSILNVFGISVDSLRVAGGILLFKVAFDMLLSKVSGESVTEEEIHESLSRDDVWIFPIALPLMTGPATITTVVVLSGTSPLISYKLVVLLAFLLTFGICFVTLYYSRRLYKLIGYTGAHVITRLLGLFLAALAVDFVTHGVWNIYSNLAGIT
ncbi:MarC family transcriptional regulator [Methanococcoides methylutens]|uniref:UPF0056 membrane protein n=1 Tax=Methanococcoides methylutens TaxID=2226 RepID=A0A099T0L5_METMT|nr:MarC family protein [Methanococcoides methylutens]KGK98720.1 MarC family transcriptional regulator [Methanococcoides methylutens]